MKEENENHKTHEEYKKERCDHCFCIKVQAFTKDMLPHVQCCNCGIRKLAPNVMNF